MEKCAGCSGTGLGVSKPPKPFRCEKCNINPIDCVKCDGRGYIKRFFLCETPNCTEEGENSNKIEISADIVEMIFFIELTKTVASLQEHIQKLEARINLLDVYYMPDGHGDIDL